MNTKECTAFLKICEHGSVRKAAKDMYITPQGLSRQINCVEAKLGAPLFVRTHEGFRLTEYGRIFKAYAEKVVRQTEELQQDILELRQKNSGAVSLSCSFLVECTHVYAVLEDFPTLHPEQKLDIIRSSDAAVQCQIAEGLSEIALTIIPEDLRPFDHRILQKSRFLLLVRETEPLANRKRVNVTDLAGERLILLHEEFASYHKVINACRQANIEPWVSHTVTGAATAARLSKSGKGVAILMDFLIDELDLSGIRAIPFDESLGTCDIGILTKRDAVISAPAVLLIEYLCRHFNDHAYIEPCSDEQSAAGP